MTYYVNTDITPFTLQYLKATPWDDPASTRARRRSPTCAPGRAARCSIQHGGADAPRARRPTHVSSTVRWWTWVWRPKLTIYPGFGHGLNKPKAVLAALEENRDWFDARLFAPSRARRSAPTGVTLGRIPCGIAGSRRASNSSAGLIGSTRNGPKSVS
jgi:hypothetical protein